jgi:endonuclease III
LKKALPVGWEQVAIQLNTSHIEDTISVAGLAQVHAERLLRMLKVILDERGEANFEYLQSFHWNDDIAQELSRFKGRGHKTISYVLLFVVSRSNFPVDTHVLRILKQMRWVLQSYPSLAAYQYLNALIRDKCKLDLNCLLVTYGRQCNKCAASGGLSVLGTMGLPIGSDQEWQTGGSRHLCNFFTGDQNPATVKEDKQSRSTHLFKPGLHSQTELN